MIFCFKKPFSNYRSGMFSSSSRVGGDRRRVGRLRNPPRDDHRDQVRRNRFESQKISGSRTLQKWTLYITRRITGNLNVSFFGNKVDCSNIDWSNIYCSNIDCLNIDCSNIDCLNIDCSKKSCLNYCLK